MPPAERAPAGAPLALRLEGLAVHYGGQEAVAAVDASFERAALHAIVGPNGAGKSSLMAAIAGLQPCAGTVALAQDLRGRVGYLPQRSQVDRSFPIRVSEFAAMGLWPRLGAWRGLDSTHSAAVQQVLQRLGLQPLGRRLIAELSTGQFQRLLFARLCLQEAQLLLLDEPLAALDEDTTTDLLALLQAWRRQGRTVIAVLHEQALVRAHFDSALLLARGVVLQGSPEEALAPSAWRTAERQLAARPAMLPLAA